jgi:hypothetical protein
MYIFYCLLCVGAGNVARDADGAAPEAGSLHSQVQGDPGEGKGTRPYVMMDSISYETEMEFLNGLFLRFLGKNTESALFFCSTTCYS